MTVHVTLGLVLLPLLATLSVPFVRSEGELEQCSQRDGIRSIQQKCSEHEEALTLAENSRDDRGVCRHLYNGLVCVAERVPQCFNLYFQVMSHYVHSPHRCQLSQDQILQLQRLVASPPESEKEEAKEEEEKISTPPSLPPAPPPRSIDNIDRQTPEPGLMGTKTKLETPETTNVKDKEDKEIWIYLETDTNGTALFDESSDLNVTERTPAPSGKNGVTISLGWTSCSVCYLAYLVLLLSWKLIS